MSAARAFRPALAAARRTVAPRTAFRGYATPAGPDSKPPVALFGVDGTYASALYTAAAKQSTLDPTARAIASLLQVLKNEPRLQGLIGAPTLTQSDKSQIVAELEKHTGGADKSGTVKNFLSTLAQNNRLGLLQSACEKFGELISAGKGELELKVVSAQELDNRTLKRIEQAISKSEYSQGQKIKVTPKVDPSILGGLIVEIGERTIDTSVAAKVSRLNKLLQESV
ncbi:ATP synthase subunit 5, mitochondrial [Cyphellophora attinorum]|uniref:ATP synthase subunit 5, mitochondrial n=1 Tax=Cyphellophora attinorum TaxID=1664694 RepID=A0A0N1P1M2_9EURO|nr:ATP synthase subunit 5, mitochondrial [Phialophora attinorum]KPI45086.1 ATP synthase subunit 5, mitochondrial [Phialophora attinorum]